jgi:hypothetical protein
VNLNISRDWLLRMAEKEANGIVSVGGFFYREDFAMSEASHTPLPWTRDRHGIYGPDGEPIQVAGVSLVLNGTAAQKAEAEANRDLLFAAPGMIEALRRIAEHTDPDSPEENYRADDPEGCLDTVFSLAKRAIAAATKGGDPP